MKKKSLKINSFLNSVRTILGTILQLITYPYILRVLGIENMGKVNFSASVISYFILFALLEFNGYAAREGAKVRNNRDAYTEFASQIFTINILSMILSYILLAITVCLSSTLHAYLALLAIQSFQILGNVIAIEWHYIVYEDYLYITLRSVIVQIASVLMLFCFVRHRNDYIIYVAINTFSLSGGYFLNFAHALKDYKIHVTSHPKIKKHIKPILIFFAIKASTTVYISADTTMLGFLCNDYYTGLYSLVNKVYMIIKSLVQSVFSVALSRLTEEISNGELEAYNRDVGNIFDTLVLFLLPIMVGLFLTARDIVIMLGGSDYLPAVFTLRILSIALVFAMFSGFIISTLFMPDNGEKYIMAITALSAFENIALNFWFIPLMKDKGAAITTCIAEATCMLCMMLIGRKRFSFPVYVRNIAGYVFGTFGIIGVCFVIGRFKMPVILGFAVKVALSAILYFAIQFINGNPFFRGVVEKVLGFKNGCLP